MTLTGGYEAIPFDLEEMGRLGYRFIVDPMTPVLALHRAMRETYEALAGFKANPLLAEGFQAEHDALNRAINLEALLEIERQTVER